MFSRHDEVRTWYVVFCRRVGPCHHFWQPFLKKEFSHVYLLSDAGPKGTLKFEPLIWGTAVTYWDVPLDDVVMQHALLERTTAVLAFTVDYNRMPDWYVPRGVYNCVSACKSVLGLQRTRFVLTPFQLYKWLLKNYAIPAKAYVPFIKPKGEA